jgi:4-hydroxy 2-oxovalerate aldolase
LRDGCYIVNGEFGTATIKGIIKRLQEAKVEIIECGWLKDEPHKYGTAYYNVPSDLEQYLSYEKSPNTEYVAMIDYNRYDISRLPLCDHFSIDAIRVVFPKNKVDEGLALVEPIREKGYKVYLQAANTLAYTDAEILSLIDKVNYIKPDGISIVDTFGAMYGDDLTRIMSLFEHNLDTKIRIGLHSHNNLQMSFSLAIQFLDTLVPKNRNLMVDSSLCGMGRGAGNANTELVVAFLNKKYNKDYDINTIIDTIDIYMTHFQNKYEWGYSMPYYISGMYQSHVNNITYLIKNHKTKSRDLKVIVESLDEEKRRIYDYDNLESVYCDYIKKEVDDRITKENLKEQITNKNVVLVVPGPSAYSEIQTVKSYIDKRNAVVIGINSIIPGYEYDYVFFSNAMRFDYVRESYPEQFGKIRKIVTSNITTESEELCSIININNLIKKVGEHFDNATFLCLRLLDCFLPKTIGIAGFDGYTDEKNYFDENLELGLSRKEKTEFNNDLKDMMYEFIQTTNEHLDVYFVTESMFDCSQKK